MCGTGLKRKNRRGVTAPPRLIDRGVIAIPIIHICAVKQKVVGASARAVHRKSAERAWRIRNLVWGASHTGVQVDKLGVVTSVNRQILDRGGGRSYTGRATGRCA